MPTSRNRSRTLPTRRPGWLSRVARQRHLVRASSRSKLTMVAAAVTAAVLRCARPGAAARAAQPVRPGAARADEQPSCRRSGAPDGQMPVPARHRRPGPRRALGHPLRRAHLAAGRLRSACCSRRARHRARADRRLSRRHASTRVIMRIADVQLTFPAILIALLIDGVAQGGARRAAAMTDDACCRCWSSSIGLSFWVQYARTVRGSMLVEKNKEYVAGRAPDRPARAARSCCATSCPT